MAQTGSYGHHRRRLHHRGTSEKSRLHHARPAGRTQARRIQRRDSRHHHHDARSAQGDGTRQQGHCQVQEHVRTGHLLLPVQPPRGLRQALPRFEIRQEEPRRGRSQQAGHRRRLQLRGQHPPVRQYLYGGSRQARKGHLPHHLGQRRHGMGSLRRSREGRPAALLRFVSHHPRHGDSRGAGQAQGPRCEDRTGRG